jgi:hypothetical protein
LGVFVESRKPPGVVVRLFALGVRVASAGPVLSRSGGAGVTWSVATWVEWCGHQVEVVLMPEGDGWDSEIPVLGVAR